MHDIFISYSRADKKIVDTFVKRLQENGFTVWIDRKGIESGDAFKSVIVNAITECTVVLFFSSVNSNKSKWTAKEIGLATEFSKPIIPIKLDRAKYGSEVLFDLVNLDFIDYTDSFKRKEMMEKLVQVLHSKINREISPTTLPKPLRRLSLLWEGVVILVILLLLLGGYPLFTNKNKSVDNSSYAQFEPELLYTIGKDSIKMVFVKGGTYKMGAQKADQGLPGYDEDAAEDEEPVHDATVKHFYISEAEVTQSQWLAVMGVEPTAGGGWGDQYGKGNNYPAYNVSWNDVQKFIEKLNSLKNEHFRLPTEAEWEYAARGGRSQSYKYSGSDHVEYVCWYSKNATKTSPVKQRQPNELKLYDMSGNVWEWCSDHYHVYTSDDSQSNSVDSHQNDYVCRGGSWGSGAWRCRVSTRKSRSVDHVSKHLGFRIVLDAKKN